MNETIYNHSKKLYDHLKEEAFLEDGSGALVWTGPIAKEVRAAGVPSGSHGVVIKHLIFNGCISLVHRGSGKHPTVIELLRNPSELDVWLDAPAGDLTARGGSAMLTQRIQNIENLLGGINIREAFRDISQELREVKDRLDKLDKERTQ